MTIVEVRREGRPRRQNAADAVDAPRTGLHHYNSAPHQIIHIAMHHQPFTATCCPHRPVHAVRYHSSTPTIHANYNRRRNCLITNAPPQLLIFASDGVFGISSTEERLGNDYVPHPRSIYSPTGDMDNQNILGVPLRENQSYEHVNIARERPVVPPISDQLEDED